MIQKQDSVITKACNIALEKYEKENFLEFSDNVKTKLINSYVSTLFTEKDITLMKWLEENIDDILDIYKDEITFKK